MAKSENITSRTFSDLSCNAYEAYNIASLMLWICEARALIERVRMLAEVDLEFQKRLTDHKVAYASACWDGETADGMELLLLKHRSTIREIADTATLLEAGHD
ncbi:hypothetical protein [Variovorax boronicumulans]|uniref:hypothetical protein n=1 Tax=Variovorax boronicumulans TaxID=436515 RepID=UPI0033937B1D